MIASPHANGPVVCILTAGRGTRLGSSLAALNKALLPLRDRALISHIIESFPPTARFVIALGYNADQVRGYLALAHPTRQFTFVHVDPWTGPGSGPGRSLLACRHELSMPFYFVACDALPTEPIDMNHTGDWIGVADVPAEHSAQYCNARLDGDRVIALLDKTPAHSAHERAFTGIMRIESTERFWTALDGSGEIAGEHQVSGGLQALVDAGTLRAIDTPWQDLGDEAAYRDAVAAAHGYDFSKPGEALYMVDGRVIKLFADTRLASDRIDRAARNRRVFPELLAAPEGFIAYEFVPGTTLYNTINVERFQQFLTWCAHNLWKPIATDHNAFATSCRAFYHMKTRSRISTLTQDERQDTACINGHAAPSINALLDGFPWTLLDDGLPVFFHGDLQFDNVLRTNDNSFLLLDWRPDFAGDLYVGDLYYDLGKLLGGIRVDYSRVKRGVLSYERRDDGITFELPHARHHVELEETLRTFATERSLDWPRIELITGIIFLNMAPLHTSPFREAMIASARLALQHGLCPA
ncbi:MAG: NTP transferase domain-containing protein [Phycisphaerales bacterium]|nr:NTP transferase domain-containing protein [Phycisphaerales bacterium]